MQVPNYNSNLAYDLSRFDVAEQEKHVAHRRKEQEQHKQQIQMNAHSVSRSGSRLKVLAVGGLVFAALCVVNIQQTKADDWARMVADQQAALSAAQEENELLQTRLDSKMNNIGYIEEYATMQLGMAKVTNTQVQYLKVNTESLIEVQPDGSGSLYETVSGWWGEFMEYIGL